MCLKLCVQCAQCTACVGMHNYCPPLVLFVLYKIVFLHDDATQCSKVAYSIMALPPMEQLKVYLFHAMLHWWHCIMLHCLDLFP